MARFLRLVVSLFLIAYSNAEPTNAANLENAIVDSENIDWSEPEQENEVTMEEDEDDTLSDSRRVPKFYCPPNFGYSVNGFPKCYSVITTKLGWDNAQAACGKLHPRAHLAIINSPLEAQIISEILQKYMGSVCYNSAIAPNGNLNEYRGSWIGGQRVTIGDCKSPFIWKPNRNTQLPIAYTNWYKNEPGCGFGQESCAAVLLHEGSNMQWHDYICSWPMCAVCEVAKYTRFK